MRANFKILRALSDKNQIILCEEQLARLEYFAELLEEGNKKMNLTAITQPDEVEVKHMIDSLEAVDILRRLIPQGCPYGVNVLDIGCGAGFPGIPLAIALPEMNFTLMDSVRKKICFVTDAAVKLELKNVQGICSRAEDAAGFIKTSANPSNSSDKKPGIDTFVGVGRFYDFVTVRAVSEIRVLLEYSLPYLKIGGHCIFYKSGEYEAELANAANALDVLGGQFICTENYNLPMGYGSRSLIVVKKISETSAKYPRRAGIPAKRPL